MVLFGWAAVIIAWERLAPYRKGLSLFREGFWVDLVWYTIIQSFVLKIVIFDYIIMPLQQHFDWSSLQFISKWPLALQVLFFLVTHDLYIYLFHRFQHSNKFFWRIHEAHHSGKEVDFLAGSRSHVMEIIINQTIEFAPILLLGASPEVVPVKALIDSMYGMYIHANIDVKMGKLKYIFNSPSCISGIMPITAKYSMPILPPNFLYGTISSVRLTIRGISRVIKKSTGDFTTIIPGIIFYSMLFR